MDFIPQVKGNLMIKPKILFYDCETKPLQAWVWSTGKQFVSHKQLVADYSRYGIICITYCWNDGKPAKCIDWGYEEQDTGKVIQEFDSIVKQADFCIGKNNINFDVKMINAARMFADLPGLPEWTRQQDDLEKQMRKYFRMPSQSLDYISNQLGLGGKIKMEFQDWIDICEKNSNGIKALKKMIKYGKKDVEDTRFLWEKLSKHFEPRFNLSKHNEYHTSGCKHCGSLDLAPDGSTLLPSTGERVKKYRCRTCGKYAGREMKRGDRLV